MTKYSTGPLAASSLSPSCCFTPAVDVAELRGSLAAPAHLCTRLEVMRYRLSVDVVWLGHTCFLLRVVRSTRDKRDARPIGQIRKQQASQQIVPQNDSPRMLSHRPLPSLWACQRSACQRCNRYRQAAEIDQTEHFDECADRPSAGSMVHTLHFGQNLLPSVMSHIMRLETPLQRYLEK
jgi:hypothetical protein